MRDLYISNLLGWTGHFYLEDPAIREGRFWVMRSSGGCIEFRLAKWRGCVSRVARHSMKGLREDVIQATGSERRDAA